MQMKEDNTPTVTKRRRNPTPHQRLRLEKAKELKKAGALPKKKKKPDLIEEGGAVEESSKTASMAATDVPKLKKNVLSEPVKPPAKFRKRQVNKSWLPSHVWYAKRARMTEPMDPLWRFAIALSPTEKCYRITHRSGSVRGCVAWDTSYMSTICAEGPELSLLGFLRSVGVEEDMLTGKEGTKWRHGTRSWKGWIRERDNEKRWLAPVLVVWRACKEDASREGEDSEKKRSKPKRTMLLQTHPSGFLHVWNELVKVSKLQRPPVTIEDLRFEIGSIEIIGPAATEALVGVLHPILSNVISPERTAEPGAQPSLPTDVVQDSTKNEDCADRPQHGDTFLKLASLTNSASLPKGALLAFDITDPRLHHPPQTVKANPEHEHGMIPLLAQWPLDQRPSPSSLFLRQDRLKASRLPSQKNINRRKAAADPGEHPSPLKTDPAIPVMLLASRSPRIGGHANSMQGSWTLLLPWSCVLPVWYSLVHYPLASGNKPRFGGLEEMQEIALDRQTPWFPGDYPGTSAGWAWELREREKARQEWERKPKGKRCEWNSLPLGEGRKGEIGIGWGCDWERLFTGPPPPSGTNQSDKAAENTANVTERGTDAESSKNNQQQHPQIETSPQDSTDHSRPPPAPPLSIQHVPLPFPPSPQLPATALTPIHLTLLTAGHPTRNARIYRLPTTSPELLSRWAAQIPPSSSKSSTSSRRHPRHNENPGKKKQQQQQHPPRSDPGRHSPQQASTLPSTAPLPPSLPPSTTAPPTHDHHQRYIPLGESYDAQTPQYVKTARLAQSLLHPRPLPLPESTSASTSTSASASNHPPPPRPQEQQQQQSETLKPNHPSYPPCPDENDLIGFVTSANYTLATGTVTAVGNVAVARVLQQCGGSAAGDAAAGHEHGGHHTPAGSRGRICIVRNAGESIGRLARWRRA